MMLCIIEVFATAIMVKSTDKLFFWLVVIYLPLSIFWIFFLYLVAIVFPAESWQFQLFYGEAGNAALVWLLVVLLPAILFLVLKARGKKLVSRLSGVIGFYCLLASLLSVYNILVVPGLVFIVISVVVRRQLKKN